MLNKNDNLIKKTTNKTGCYLFKNKDNNVIYVGKAKNIQKRIKQHFQAQKNNSKTAFMLKETDSWETFITNNEKEAFILENNLIKQHYPKFNIILVDDQTYPYIFINKESKDPKYFLIWKKVKQSGTYYGPFLSRNNGQEILNLLQTLFPIRYCKKNKLKKPCFYYHLQKCSGACFKTVPSIYYESQAKKVKLFFRGKVKQIKKDYEKKIKIASANLQFEQAHEWNNLLNKIDQFIENQVINYNKKNNVDFINFYEEKNEILIIIFLYRQGKLILKKEGLFSLFNNSISETIENFLQEHYTYHPLPEEIVLPKTLAQHLVSLHYKAKITYSQRGTKHQILNLIHKNAKVLLQKQAVENKQKNKIETLNKLRIILKNKKPIVEIDFLDLSYFDTKNVVAGFTHYLNGNQVFNKNKIYQLKNQAHHDEKKYFEWAISEHYQDHQLPDLLILDGGFTQLIGAKKGLAKLKQKTKMIGLVKDEKHQSNYILTETKTKILLPKNETLWLFLSKIQSLGHLYVIKNLRNLNKLKNFTNSLVKN